MRIVYDIVANMAISITSTLLVSALLAVVILSQDLDVANFLSVKRVPDGPKDLPRGHKKALHAGSRYALGQRIVHRSFPWQVPGRVGSDKVLLRTHASLP